MHPDESRSTHLLLPPSSVRSRGGRSKSTICTRSTTIHPSLPNLGNDSRRVSKVSHSTFPPLSFSSKFSSKNPLPLENSHEVYYINLPIILLIPQSILTHSHHPSSFHPSILLRTLPQRNLVAPLHGALFHSPIPGELSVSMRHTGWMPKRSSTGSTGEAV